MNYIPVFFVMTQNRDAFCRPLFLEDFIFEQGPGFLECLFVQVSSSNSNMWMKRPVVQLYFTPFLAFKKAVCYILDPVQLLVLLYINKNGTGLKCRKVGGGNGKRMDAGTQAFHIA